MAAADELKDAKDAKKKKEILERASAKIDLLKNEMSKQQNDINSVTAYLKEHKKW